MHPLVNDPSGVLGEGFAAEVAGERLFTRVDSDMQNKLVSLLKLLVALHALECLLPFMTLVYMSDEDGVLFKNFPTKATSLLLSGRLLQVHVDFNAVILVQRQVFFFIPVLVCLVSGIGLDIVIARWRLTFSL